MPKLTAPLMSMDASGKLNDTLVFMKGGYARIWVKPANPQTAAQQLVRNRLGDIQRILKLLGSTLRAELKSQFGYRWNSMIIKELTNNSAAKLIAYQAEFDAFGGTDQTAWAAEDDSVPVELDDGQPLYVTAKAIKDIEAVVGATLSLTAPVATNSSTISGEWVA